MSAPVMIARTPEGADLGVLPSFANRHGLITGATGTGKTVTLQVLAERFSRLGVPCFMADVKGDLAGLGASGSLTPKLQERLSRLGFAEPAWGASPIVCWDLAGRRGHPVRATVSDMGPLLLGRLLALNATQQGVLTMTFKIADDAGLLLLDLKDLRSMLQFTGDNARSFTTEYGHISTASIGAIQRALLALEHEGADGFFGEPMLDVDDLFRTDAAGRGILNILAADDLLNAPKLYATFLLWMLSAIFERLPEAGDPEKPKLVFFFDEAHLLFDDAPEALVEKIEQVIRLIRSKGVGVYFITQNPLDVPETVLGQLGNRVQHALRAFTPRDQKAVKTAAETLRPNPRLDVERAITELAVGEALVSFLDAGGSPTVVERAWISPPGSRMGPLTDAERTAILESSELRGRYEETVDRESAYEKLAARAASLEAAPDAAPGARRAPGSRTSGGRGRAREPRVPGAPGTLGEILFGSTGPRGGRREGVLESAAKSAARSVGSSVGREIVRGVLGSILGRRR